MTLARNEKKQFGSFYNAVSCVIVPFFLLHCDGDVNLLSLSDMDRDVLLTLCFNGVRFGSLHAEADDEEKRQGEQEMVHGVSFASNVTLLQPDCEDESRVWKKVPASLVTAVYDDTGEGLLKRPFEDGVLCICLIKHVQLRLGEVMQGRRRQLRTAEAAPQ